MNIITGGVTAPKGFKAAGIHCGVKDNFTTPVPDKKDLAMVLSDVPCAAAGTYTRNVVKADPVILTKEYLADHKAQGIILDSGNANACAPNGPEHAEAMCAAAAAVTAGRTALWHIFFAAEGNNAVAAVTGLYVDLCVIIKHGHPPFLS